MRSELKTRLPTPKDVKISAKSTLVIKVHTHPRSASLTGGRVVAFIATLCPAPQNPALSSYRALSLWMPDA